MTFLRSGCTSSPNLKRATLMEISMLGSSAAARRPIFILAHSEPAQQEISRRLSVVSCPWSVVGGQWSVVSGQFIPDSEVGAVCHPEPRLVGAEDLCSCFLRLASGDKLQGRFAEF